MNEQLSLNGDSSTQTQMPIHSENTHVTDIEMQPIHIDDKSHSSTHSDSRDRSPSLFRPYVSHVPSSVPNSRNSSYDIIERNLLPDNLCERASRPVQRGFRRTQSKSVPRANQLARDQEKPNSKNSKPGTSTQRPIQAESRDSATLKSDKDDKNKQSESPPRHVNDNTHNG